MRSGRVEQVQAVCGVRCAVAAAYEPPGPEAPADHVPKLTVGMVARIQGFPDEWEFAGGKTAQYRQVGNAFPPPVAAAVGQSIQLALAVGHRPAGRFDRSGSQHLPVVVGQEALF